MFPRIEYLEWIEGRPEAALHDLGVSGLRGDREFGTPIPDILSTYADPPAGVTMETQLATLYGVNPESVLVTAGAGHANFLAMAATLDDESHQEGAADRVLVESPTYEPLVKTPQGLGATVDRFHRPRSEDYVLDRERVTEAIDDETVLVAVTNRHNPSGRLVDESTLATINDAVRSAGTRLLVDEIYAPFMRTDMGTGAFGEPTAVGLDDVVVTNSVTKCFGLGDIRIGWLIADPGFIDRARHIQTHVQTVAATSRALGRRTLHAAESLTSRARSILSENADLLSTFVADHPQLQGPVYDGSTFAFISHETVDGDTLSAAAAEAGILVVPGRFFGDTTGVRVSLGRDPTDCAASLQALSSVVDELHNP